VEPTVPAQGGPEVVATTATVPEFDITKLPYKHKPFEISLDSLWSFGGAGGFITAMAQDKEGAFWFGSEEYGVVRLAADERTHFTQKDGLGDSNSYAITVDADNNVWVGTLNHGVSVYDGENWTTYGLLDGPGGLHVYSLATGPDEDGNPDKVVWIGTENGVARFDGKRWKTFGIADGLPCREILALDVAPAGMVWAGGAMGGVGWYDGEAWHRIGKEQGLPDERVNAICAASDGRVWIGTCNGIACYDPRKRGDKGQWRLEPMAPPPGACFGPVQTFVTCIAEDQTGRLWFGSRRGGLSMYDPNTRDWEHFTRKSHGLPDNYISRLTVAQDGHLWVGTYGYGVCSTRPEESTAARNIKPNSKALTPPPPATAAWDEEEYTRRLEQVTRAAGEPADEKPVAVYLGEDWQTRGDWMGEYGKYRYVLAAMGYPFNFEGGLSSDAVGYKVLIGSNRADKVGLAGWVQKRHTDEVKCLQNPGDKDRRHAHWSDRGETTSIKEDGPHLYINLAVKEEGVFRLAFYFINTGAHDLRSQGGEDPVGANRFREFAITVKQWTPTDKDTGPDQWPGSGYTVWDKGWVPADWEYDAQPVLAACRVRDFAPGVYKRFLLTGPAVYRIRIDRDHSHNTICSGFFMDRLDEENEIVKSLATPTTDPDAPAAEEVPEEEQPPVQAAPAEMLLERARSFYAAVHQASKERPELEAVMREHLLYLCSKLQGGIRLLGANDATLELQRLIISAVYDAGFPHTELQEVGTYARMWRELVENSENKPEVLERFGAAAQELMKLYFAKVGTGSPRQRPKRDATIDTIWRPYLETVAKSLPRDEATAKLLSLGISHGFARARFGDGAWAMLENEIEGFEYSHINMIHRACNLQYQDRYDEALRAYESAAALTEKVEEKAHCYESVCRIAAVFLKDEKAARAGLKVLGEIAPGSKQEQVAEYWICLKAFDRDDKATAVRMAQEFLSKNPDEGRAKDIRRRMNRYKGK